jgi:hypothetical protein
VGKSERFGMILSPAEKIAGQKLAEREGGLSLAALIRRLIRVEADKQNLWPPDTAPTTSDRKIEDESR